MYKVFINDYLFYRKNFKSVETLLDDQIIVYAPRTEGYNNRIVMPLVRGKYNPLNLIKNILFFFRYVTKNNTNIFITIIPIVVGALICKIKRIPGIFYFTGLGTIFTDESWYSKYLKSIVLMYFKFFLNKFGHKVIVQNTYDYKFIKNDIGLNRVNIFKIDGCGVDTQKFPFSPKYEIADPLKILVPARLIREKGIYEAIEASKILNNRKIQHLFIFSSSIDLGNPSSLTKKEIESFKQIESVKFTGYVENINELYSQVDIVCLPSYREGLPNSLIEASAYGRLIIASDVPGCNDVIGNEENGMLFNVRDPVSIADAIENIVRHKINMKVLIDNAYQKVLNIYSSKIILSKLAKELEDFNKKII